MLGIELGAIAGLIALCALASASETAFTAASRARMQELARRGDSRAALVNRLMQSPERLTEAFLLAGNLGIILASALATAAFVHFFPGWGVLYAALAMTALVLVFGQVLPKACAMIDPHRAAMVAAPVVSLLIAVFSPPVQALQWLIRRALHLVGVDIGQGSILTVQQELRGVIALRHQEGAVVKQDRDMLGGILDLSELELSDLMVHRTKMHTIDAARPQKEIIEEVLKSGHSRIPLWRDQPDNIVGVLHVKDLLAAYQSADGDASKIDVEAMCVPPWFVPDTTTVNDQLAAFLRRKSHFALVVDEYGEVMGLVTLEDILEEIVGDITDEHDVAVAGVRREASGSFVVDGTVPVRDLNRTQDWRLPDHEATTIAGLVIHETQMIPDTGQAFTFHGFRFEILRKRRHQLTLLRITPLGP